jgi:teichuronic acid biosynthesis glycosyltransferase TuaH
MAVVIYPKTLDWTFMKQRPQQLMTQLGKLGHTVYFENLSPVSQPFVEVADNVFLFSDTQHFLNHVLPKVRESQKVVFWTTWAQKSKLIPMYKPDKVVYDCCDEFPQWAKYEQSMIEAADHVVCSAKSIYDRVSLSHPGVPLTLIRNGVDDSFFLEASRGVEMERPADLPDGKIVGYIGAWAYWVDHELIKTAAKRFPNVHFVAIGVPYGQVPSYQDCPNVHILGQKPHDQLLRYLRHFEVAIIPFQYHPITLATNPIKAYEYLATGVKVLSTALPECIAMEPYLKTATSHFDFIRKLEYMLSYTESEAGKRPRIEFAKRNTWTERGKQADQVIRSLVGPSA